MTVSKSKINSGDFFEVLKFAFLADTENFKKSFEKFGFTVTDENDLKTLAELSKSGSDKSGQIVIDNKKIIFDIKDIVNKIDMRYAEVKKANMMQYIVD